MAIGQRMAPNLTQGENSEQTLRACQPKDFGHIPKIYDSWVKTSRHISRCFNLGRLRDIHRTITLAEQSGLAI
jgi:hypothetical protein